MLLTIPGDLSEDQLVEYGCAENQGGHVVTDFTDTAYQRELPGGGTETRYSRHQIVERLFRNGLCWVR